MPKGWPKGKPRGKRGSLIELRARVETGERLSDDELESVLMHSALTALDSEDVEERREARKTLLALYGKRLKGDVPLAPPAVVSEDEMPA